MLISRRNLSDFLELEENEIAEYCDEYLKAGTLAAHIDRLEPFGRKDLCQYLGIGESTLSGWLKEDRIPLMAKEAFMLPHVIRVLGDEIERLRAEAERPRILKNGDTYQLCVFKRDTLERLTGGGGAIGEVLADNIPSVKLARTLVAGFKALRLLKECDQTAIDFGIATAEGDGDAFSEQLQELRDEIGKLRLLINQEELQKGLDDNSALLDAALNSEHTAEVDTDRSEDAKEEGRP